MKIKEFKCRNCQNDDFQFMTNPSDHNVVGIYCSRCGKWFKWADKDEKNLLRLALMNEERIKQEREKEFFDTLEENLTKADIAFRAYERGYADAKKDIREGLENIVGTEDK